MVVSPKVNADAGIVEKPVEAVREPATGSELETAGPEIGWYEVLNVVLLFFLIILPVYGRSPAPPAPTSMHWPFMLEPPLAMHPVVPPTLCVEPIVVPTPLDPTTPEIEGWIAPGTWVFCIVMAGCPVTVVSSLKGM